ncbi:hypothetical protein EWM64_g1250 [Hericium alpestre]|uniref:Hepatocellular carcinoma-associated antigen 59 domain-containing protein n=1 Tax=Hericium alpestre TaxID=135208 RepID=A0A4Z0A8V2_9AGAM|nr:hypothetical protein EWM64_g1250 [Hericium alpestre]
MIRKRSRPQTSTREHSLDIWEKSPEVGSPSESAEGEEDVAYVAFFAPPVADLIELRKWRRQKGGIDITRLGKGDAKKKKKKEPEEEAEPEYGLKLGTKVDAGEDSDEDDKAVKARRAVRSNIFTQQTNALDVDKHMMAYIEENMKLRRGAQKEADGKPIDEKDEISRLSEKYKIERKAMEEGNVTNSMAMLTAIPEVDLGMDARLKNIEDTEKAKLLLNRERKGKKADRNDEEHLVASRFYRPNLRMKSDEDIIRDAKLEAMGLQPEDHEHHRPRHDRPQMATDEMVMERFKKRMRK